jgi:hypothetical protein
MKTSFLHLAAVLAFSPAGRRGVHLTSGVVGTVELKPNT